MKSLARWAAMAFAASITAAAFPARADDWARFTWDGRDGSGDILYRRDVPITDPANGGVTLQNSIHSFNVVGWHELSEGHWFVGNGGSVVTHTAQEPCEDGMGDLCTRSFVTFKLGALSNGDPKPWQVNITLPWNGRLEADGRLPLFPGTDEFEGWASFGGHISNTVNDERYGTLNMFSRVHHSSVAAPVPEPALPLLMGLGMIGVAFGASRRRA